MENTHSVNPPLKNINSLEDLKFLNINTLFKQLKFFIFDNKYEDFDFLIQEIVSLEQRILSQQSSQNISSQSSNNFIIYELKDHDVRKCIILLLF